MRRRHAARAGRRRLPGRHQVGARPRRRLAPLPGRQRRRERDRHLQGPPAHGAGSPPADRGLPHRLLRRGPVAVLPLHPGGDGLRPGAGGEGAERGLRRRLHGPRHPGLPAQRRHLPHLGRGRLHRGRGDRPHRVAGGQPGHAPAQAAVLPRRHRPLRPAHDRQQRGDAVEPAVADGQRRRRLQALRLGDLARHPALRRVRPRGPPRRLRGAARHHHVPPAVLRPAVLPGHAVRAPPQDVHPRWRLLAVVLRRAARPAPRGPSGRCGRVDARARARWWSWTTPSMRWWPACGSCASSPASRAASARRAARARTGSRRSCAALLDGHGRPSDIDLLLDIGDNISPGPYPAAGYEAEGLAPVPFPPRQTTICPLGPLRGGAGGLGHPPLPVRVRGQDHPTLGVDPAADRD